MYWDVTIVQPLKNYRIYVELENGHDRSLALDCL
mgnify:CR=1 FL=1